MKLKKIVPKTLSNKIKLNVESIFDKAFNDLTSSLRDLSLEMSFAFFLQRESRDLESEISVDAKTLLTDYANYIEDFLIDIRTDYLELSSTRDYLLYLLLDKHDAQDIYFSNFTILNAVLEKTKDDFLANAISTINVAFQDIEIDYTPH